MNKLTEMVFIMDRSGSMQGLEDDTIGGFNSMIEKQKSKEGDAVVTTVLFDDQYELLHDRVDLQRLNKIMDHDYYVRGSTALMDAVGKTISKVNNTQKHDKADKVVFIIITDGYENASKEYSQKKIKTMIEKQKKDYDWEFIFLGANIDAVAAAKEYGIDEINSVKYCADSIGTNISFSVISEAVSSIRKDKKLSKTWKNKIEKDMKERG